MFSESDEDEGKKDAMEVDSGRPKKAFGPHPAPAPSGAAPRPTPVSSGAAPRPDQAPSSAAPRPLQASSAAPRPLQASSSTPASEQAKKATAKDQMDIRYDGATLLAGAELGVTKEQVQAIISKEECIAHAAHTQTPLLEVVKEAYKRQSYIRTCAAKVAAEYQVTAAEVFDSQLWGQLYDNAIATKCEFLDSMRSAFRQYQLAKTPASPVATLKPKSTTTNESTPEQRAKAFKPTADAKELRQKRQMTEEDKRKQKRLEKANKNRQAAAQQIANQGGVATDSEDSDNLSANMAENAG